MSKRNDEILIYTRNPDLSLRKVGKLLENGEIVDHYSRYLDYDKIWKIIGITCASLIIVLSIILIILLIS